jgi:hypothetical protein
MANDTLCKTARPVLLEFQFPLQRADHHCFTEVTGLAFDAAFLVHFHRRAEIRREIPVSAKIDKVRRLLALIAGQTGLLFAMLLLVGTCAEGHVFAS